MAVSDLAPAGGAEPLHLARRERREVVVEHVVLVRLPLEVVDKTLVHAGAERDRTERLRLAAGEQRRSVRARQQADLALDVTDFVDLAAVDADALVEDPLAHFALLDRADETDNRLLIRRIFFRQRRDDVGRDLVLLRVPGDLLRDRDRFAQAIRRQCFHAGDERLGGFIKLERDLLDADLGHDPLLELDDLLDRLVSEEHHLEHGVLADLARFAFDARKRFGDSGDDDIGVRLLTLGIRRHEDLQPLGVPCDAHRAVRAVERDLRDADRKRRADARENIRIVLLIVAEHAHRDLYFVPETLREQRADLVIDEPRRERLLVGRTAFALEYASGNLAGGVPLLPILDREREERQIGRRRRHARGDEHHRAAAAYDHRAVGLLRHTAMLDENLPVTDLQGVVSDHCGPPLTTELKKSAGEKQVWEPPRWRRTTGDSVYPTQWPSGSTDGPDRRNQRGPPHSWRLPFHALSGG